MNVLHLRFSVLVILCTLTPCASLRSSFAAVAEQTAHPADEISQLEKKRASEYAFVLHMLIQKEDYTRAVELAPRALSIPPSDPKDAAKLSGLIADVAIGLLHVEKDGQKAVDLCERALETFPDDAVLLYVASLAYKELGDEARQKKSEAELRTIKPDDQAYWFNVASYLRMKLGVRAAHDAFEIVASISPDAPTHFSADAEVAMAQISCELGDYEQALRHCENLREIARKIVVSRTNIAMLTAMVYAEKARELEIEGRYEEAIEEYKKAAEFSPQTGGTYNTIGDLYLKRQNVNEAERWFKQALSAGAVPMAHAGLGDVLQARGRGEDAENEYQKCEKAFTDEIAKNPDQALHYNNLAWFYATHDRKLDKGIELATKAIKLAPASAAYLDTLAELRFRTGDTEAAIQKIKEAIALRPPHIRYFQKQLERFQKGVSQ